MVIVVVIDIQDLKTSSHTGDHGSHTGDHK